MRHDPLIHCLPIPLGTLLPQHCSTVDCHILEPVMPRELIEPNQGDKRYARRDKEGQFTSDQTKVGKSLAADRRHKAKTVSKKGEGDRGDRKSS